MNDDVEDTLDAPASADEKKALRRYWDALPISTDSMAYVFFRGQVQRNWGFVLNIIARKLAPGSIGNGGKA